MVAASSTVALAPCWLATTSTPARAGTSGRAFSMTTLLRVVSISPRFRPFGRELGEDCGDGFELHAAASASAESEMEAAGTRIGRCDGGWFACRSQNVGRCPVPAPAAHVTAGGPKDRRTG